MLNVGEVRCAAKDIVERMKRVGATSDDIARLAREIVLLISYDSAVDFKATIKKIEE